MRLILKSVIDDVISSALTAPSNTLIHLINQNKHGTRTRLSYLCDGVSETVVLDLHISEESDVVAVVTHSQGTRAKLDSKAVAMN